MAPVSFEVKGLNAATLAATDKNALDAFSKKVAELRRVTAGADQYRSEAMNKIKFMKAAALDVSVGSSDVLKKIHDLEIKLKEINLLLNGNSSLASREFETLPSINTRIGNIQYSIWNASAAPTKTFVQSYDVAATQFTIVLADLNKVDTEIKELESLFEKSQAPATPGRLPVWKK